ncbi:lysozyme [Halomonas salifodinae]|uniref:Lysozyme n=1 Tax=Halomonas salifodinae TaxID=438745 RepID=A0ABW2F4L4_9GAMM
MELSARGLRKLQGHEGLRLQAYRCPAGVWTIGFGTTRVDGKPVTPGMVIDKSRAIELLAADAERFEDTVRRCVEVQLNQNEFDALVLLTYNIGAGALQKSTLLRKLNAGDRKGAADEFLRWNKGGGKVLPGLVKRREDERRLFLEPVEPEKADAVGPWSREVDTGGADE